MTSSQMNSNIINSDEVIDSRDKTKLIDSEKRNEKVYSSFEKSKQESPNTSTNSNNSVLGYFATRNCPTCNGSGKLKKGNKLFPFFKIIFQ